MRFREIRIVENRTALDEAEVGREYNHLEDLVFIEGSSGAEEAADILEKLGKDSSDVAIKWDGNPTAYWGREPDGEFVLVGKNGWGKNKSTSADDLANFIKSSGKGEEWRERFGNDMAQIFDVMRDATPEDFRGYVFGDLLYHPGNPYEEDNGNIVFTPNLVTYTVDKNSDLGKRMSGSKVAIAVHSKFEEFGSKKGEPVSDVKELNSDDAVVLGQTYVVHQPEIDVSEVKEIRGIAERNAQAIDSFLAPVKGLSDMKKNIYTYVNQTSRAQNLEQLEHGFFDWLENSKVSTNKQAKIKNMSEENPKALPAIFTLVKKIMSAKDHIIDQLDSADSDVKASTKGQKGGEGYVALDSKTKLVPRTRWQPN